MGDMKFTDKDIQKMDVVEDSEHQLVHGLTEEEKVVEKKLVRKIDFIIMPIILVVYLLNWIDRFVVKAELLFSAKTVADKFTPGITMPLRD